MKLKYSLVSNELTPNPDDFRAAVYVEEVKTLDQIIEKMIGYGSTVTRPEALSVLEAYYLVLEELLSEGYSINTPAYSIGPGIRGVFDAEDERFDRNKHHLYLRMNPNARLKETTRRIILEKVKAQERLPLPEKFVDVTSETTNEMATAGSIAHIKGKDLKFDPSDPQQGIFFVAAANNAETKVETIGRNMPKELIFIVPSLAAGTYRVEVRSIMHNNTNLKQGTLQHQLTVA